MQKLTSSKKRNHSSHLLKFFLCTGLVLSMGTLHLSAVDVRCPPPEKVICSDNQKAGLNCKATTHIKNSKYPEMAIQWAGRSLISDYHPRKLSDAYGGNERFSCIYDTIGDESGVFLGMLSANKFTDCVPNQQKTGFKCEF